jgi:hypothetical protein
MERWYTLHTKPNAEYQVAAVCRLHPSNVPTALTAGAVKSMIIFINLFLGFQIATWT